MSEPKQPKKLLHVIVGTPDEDNCPICKAHRAGQFEQAMETELGQVLVQELSLHEMLRCTCPLCVEARQESSEE